MTATEQARPGGTWQTVLRNLGWLLAGKGFGAVLSLVYLALAARTLQPEGFGQFTLILSTGQATAAFVSFQSWQIVVRFGMAPLAQGRRAELGRLIAFCTALDLAAAVFGCLLAVVGVLLLAPLLGWPSGLSRTALVFCAATLLSVRSTAVGVLRLFDRFGVGAAADATTPILRFLGALAVVASGATVIGFLVAWTVAEIGTALVYWTLARRVAAPMLSLPRLAGCGRAAAENPGLHRFAWMTNLSSTLQAATGQFPVLFVGLFAGPVAAGNYRLAFQLSQSVVRVADMAARAMFAELARAHLDPGGSKLDHLFRHLSRLAMAAGVAVVLVLLLGHPILRLIAGDAHEGAYRPLQLLGCAAGVELAALGFEPVLVATGYAGLALGLRAAATLCLAAAMLVLLPRYGAIGMAAAILIAALASALLFGVAALRRVRAA